MSLEIIEIKTDVEIFTKSNLVPKLRSDTAVEIARMENDLSSLRKFQVVIDPPRQKRKYKKRKKPILPRDPEIEAASSKKKSSKDLVAA